MPKNSKVVIPSARFDIVTDTMPCGKRFQGDEKQVAVKARQHLRVCKDPKCDPSSRQQTVYTNTYIQHG